MDERRVADSIRVVPAWQSICIALLDGGVMLRKLSVWDGIRPKHEYFRFESKDDSQIS